MELVNSQRLPVNQQQAWQALNDPEVLKACIPGCDQIDKLSDTEYSIGMTAAVGPVKARFKGKLTLFDLNPPRSYSIKFDGQGGVAGFGSGTAKVELEPQGEQTDLNYNVNAQVGGKLAQVGSRLIDGAARKMADDFFGRFNEEVARRFGRAESNGVPADAAPVQPDTPTDAASREASGVASREGGRVEANDADRAALGAAGHRTAPNKADQVAAPSGAPTPTKRDEPALLPISGVPLWLRLAIAVAMALLVFYLFK